MTLVEQFSGALHVLHVVEAVIGAAPMPWEIGPREELDRAIAETVWDEMDTAAGARTRYGGRTHDWWRTRPRRPLIGRSVRLQPDELSRSVTVAAVIAQ